MAIPSNGARRRKLIAPVLLAVETSSAPELPAYVVDENSSVTALAQPKFFQTDKHMFLVVFSILQYTADAFFRLSR
jgi:hypothetical protein